MANFSFDVVSDYDLAKVTNAVEQAQRDMSNRYDFKGTSAKLEFIDDKKGVKITGDSQFHLDSIIEILRKRLAGAGVSQKILDISSEPITSNLKTTWTITFKKGLNQENAKKITKLIRDRLPKVKTQIQGEEIRVTSQKKDELQSAMQIIKTTDFDFPVEFTNFR
ncbi:YajQ family cyclic di-GMP-binding protein [Candidatus Saccharibacteria bacterium RIFCSPHIGHO2_12_FULL_41_12]|nr:MAG: YajQ family cyclic di-GMP-binding protein [Candidatus Saccharibacteria bacterium RIFCSPHIGHO2_12_FULL_41_12]